MKKDVTTLKFIPRVNNVMNIIKNGILFAAFVLGAIAVNAQEKSKKQESTADLKKQLLELTQSNAQIQENLQKFDTLDFVVFTNREWTRLHESHAENVRVYWPDGHYTDGIDVHIQDLDNMFVYAPDTRIHEHPVSFGSGNFTAVIGIMEGTFTEPMPIGNGQFIQPTGKAFKISMATIARWENGKIVEEYLFWDNLTYLKQLGLSN